jgi:hypothetical protein
MLCQGLVPGNDGVILVRSFSDGEVPERVCQDDDSAALAKSRSSRFDQGSRGSYGSIDTADHVIGELIQGRVTGNHEGEIVVDD